LFLNSARTCSGCGIPFYEDDNISFILREALKEKLDIKEPVSI
jgi:hypothetical protein